ncbi:hypothetical protein [Rhodanobacter denitrificans]|uniref:hypothetical protein n=2 Tax=Rhodanobacter denitrificans TaxID=666685 RepID=UPI0012FD948A|nr:hypothetical protein [Rhodanobacter denitrificans]
MLYLAACDAHARSKEGTPMVAGKRFTAPNGHPALAWGCGPLYGINPKAPRWLILEAERVETSDHGALVFDATVVCDGARADALRYLHHHGAAGMPYLGRRRRGGAFAVLSSGSAGEVEAGPHATVAVADGAELHLDAGATVATGRDSKVQANEFARLSVGDGSKVLTDRYATIASGMNAEIQAGDGAIIAAGSMTRIKVGAGARVMVESAGFLDLGQRSVGIGRAGTRYRGADGAQFVALDVVADGAVTVLTARVGEAGVVADQWYQVKDGHFEATD